jgi:hypothetical protein
MIGIFFITYRVNPKGAALLPREGIISHQTRISRKNKAPAKPVVLPALKNWLRGLDLNQRPSGYECEGQSRVGHLCHLNSTVFMRFSLGFQVLRQNLELDETP